MANQKSLKTQDELDTLREEVLHEFHLFQAPDKGSPIIAIAILGAE